MNHEAVLLALILRNEDIWYLAALKSEFFADPNARAVFTAMEQALHEHGYISRDTVVSHTPSPEIVNRLEAEAEAEIGTANWEFHRKRIIRSWKQRALRSVYLEVSDSLNEDGEPDELADQIITDVQSIRTEHTQDASISYKERVRALLDELQRRYHAHGELPGISTGIRELDARTGGLQRRRYYLVGARPSQGKSALLGQIADNMARAGVPVGFFSLESAAEELIQRNWARQHNIMQQKMQAGFFTPSELASISKEVENFADLPLWIDDTPNTDIAHIQRQAQIWKAKYDIKALFIDYVQLVRVTKAQNRRESVEEASRSLKDMSRHLDIPVMAAAQLRRDVDDRSPHLGDFQHSSALEQDADVAILLQWLVEFGERVPVDLIIAKNRDGEKTKVAMDFNAPIVNFCTRELDMDAAEQFDERLDKAINGR